MSLIPAVESALAGMQTNLWMMEDSANRIAKRMEAVNLVPELVDLEEAKLGALANAQVAKAGDEMLGTLVDILA